MLRYFQNAQLQIDLGCPFIIINGSRENPILISLGIHVFFFIPTGKNSNGYFTTHSYGNRLGMPMLRGPLMLEKYPLVVQIKSRMSFSMAASGSGSYRIPRTKESRPSSAGSSRKKNTKDESSIKSRKSNLGLGAVTTSTKLYESTSALKTKSSLKRRDSLEVTKSKKMQSRKNSSESLISKYGGYTDDFESFEETEVKEDENPNSRNVKGILKANIPSPLLNRNNGKRRVVFNKMATLHHFPSHEVDTAREARKGNWEPAPDHDELWDGNMQDFRLVPMTPRELRKTLLREGQDMAPYFLNATYPPSQYSTYNDNTVDLDELDDYINGLTMGETNEEASCYVCKPIKKWSVDDVAKWIKDSVAGGEFFSANFEVNKIDGSTLLVVEDRELRNLGIKRRHDRQSILMAKFELMQGQLNKTNCECFTTSRQNFLDHSRSFLNSL